MHSKSLTVRVPASTSNLGSGFDTLSAALNLHLILRVEVIGEGETEWVQGDSPQTAFPEENNLVAKALDGAASQFGIKLPGLRISMHNPIPLQRGLGSSAAAIIGGIKIAERLHGEPLSQKQIFQVAYPLEGHPDNLAASLTGGWVLSLCRNDQIEVHRLTSNLSVRFVLAVPEKSVSTQEARAILPDSYSLQDATYNLQRCALLIHALSAGRKELLSEAMSDRLHQPFRSRLVSGMEELLDVDELDEEMASSLLGICISGSGSTMVALADGHFEEIGQWMVRVFSRHDTEASYQVRDLDMEGAQVLTD